MNDVAELKEYVRVHAKGQRIKGYQEVLDRIRTDDGAEAGSWTGEWSRHAERLERDGKPVQAVRCYALARFPFAGDPARREAALRGVDALDRWRAGRGIEPLRVALPEGEVRCWTSGLSKTDRKPLLIVMGGIVTVKEQWAPMLVRAKQLGMAVIVTEMPGVGENTAPYRPDSHRMLSVLLDAVADRADVSRTHATALSFSGHMALRCAVDDARIRGIVTVGAPVTEFFTDAGWQKQLPRITVDTLAQLTGLEPEGVPGGLADWALTPEQLAGLDIPVAYVASLRDEIIPQDDVKLLKERVRKLELLEHDDVHAAPGHVLQTQLWTTAALLRARGVRNAQTALINLMMRAARVKRPASR